MNHQSGRTLQETRTTLAPAEVLAAATRFFAGRQGIYAAFVERESATHVNLRGQGGEEIVVGVAADPAGGATRVTGSSYLFDMQVARFLATLPRAAASAPVDAGPTDAGEGGRAAPTPPGGATVAPPAPAGVGAKAGGSPA